MSWEIVEEPDGFHLVLCQDGKPVITRSRKRGETEWSEPHRTYARDGKPFATEDDAKLHRLKLEHIMEFITVERGKR